MTTLRQAVAQMEWTPTIVNVDLCVAHISLDGKISHHRYSENADRDLGRMGNVYIVPVWYRNPEIDPSTGRLPPIERRIDHVERVLALPFDIDLKDYLGVEKSILHAMDDDELDRLIDNLADDVIELFDRAQIPIHRLVCSGYGLFAYSYLHPDDQQRVEEIPAVHKALIARVNELHGGRLVDPAVSSAHTQLCRLVGSFNWKNPERPREVTIYQIFDSDLADLARINNFDVQPIKPRRTSVALDGVMAPLSPEREQAVIQLLSHDYRDGQRNLVALGATAMLGKAGVPLEQTEHILLAIGGGDDEIRNRLDAARRTYTKLEQGLSVAGYTRLIDVMMPDRLDLFSDMLRDHRLEHTRIETVVPTRPSEENGFFGNIYDPPPATAFFGWFDDYRRLMSLSTSGADAFHLASALVYAGGLLTRRAWVEHAICQYPNLMVVLVGDSGSAHKDTCARLAQETFDMVPHVKRMSGMETLPYMQLGSISTFEGLLDAMKDKKSSSVIIYQSEYSGLLAKARRETGSNLLPQLARLWDCPSVIENPTRTNGISIPDPFVSLIGTITPGTLAREMQMADVELGWANRTLWVYGSGKKSIPNPPAPDPLEQQRLMRELLDAFDAAVVGYHRFELTPAADRYWSEWSETNDLYSPNCRRIDSEEANNLMQRLEPNAKRIALIFAASEGNRKITQHHLEAAIGFVDWAYDHTVRDIRNWGGNDEYRLSEQILRYVAQQGGVTTRPRIRNIFGRWGDSMLIRVVDNLRKQGMISINFENGVITLTPDPLGLEEAA